LGFYILDKEIVGSRAIGEASLGAAFTVSWKFVESDVGVTQKMSYGRGCMQIYHESSA
jgi:hypothetical protein